MNTQKFLYQDKYIRIVTDEAGNLWFPGIDVCDILGYANPSDILEKNLDDDEKKLDYLLDSSGQKRKTWTINESGLYHLVITSSKPEAKKFRRWITGEVLPAIRKAGKYTTDQAQQREFELQLVMKNIATKKDELKALNTDVNKLKSKIKELEKQRDEIISNFHPRLPFPEYSQAV